jgi:hypothetical protein
VSAEGDYQEALTFTLDSIKNALLVLTERLGAVEAHLAREHALSFQAADTDYIGAEFREKWAHMMKDKV